MPITPPGGFDSGTPAPTGANPAALPVLPGAGPQVAPPPSTATPPSPADDADASKQENVVLAAQFAAADAKAKAANAAEVTKEIMEAGNAKALQDASAKEFNERFASNMRYPHFYAAWHRAKFEQWLQGELASGATDPNIRISFLAVQASHAAQQAALEAQPKLP